jgi:hypothetical protein
MNRDSEALQSLFAWLLQAPPTEATSPVEDSFDLENEVDEDGVENLELADFDPLDSEEVSVPFVTPSHQGAAPDLSQNQRGQSLKLGEIPAVQDRFQALLKRRMQTQLQQKPPLFPWETELLDYPDYEVEVQVPEQLWTAQLQNLKLRVPLPQSVLIQLLESCQEVVQSSLREGPKLLRAVESLFPDQSQILNYWTGMVLRPASRSQIQDLPLPETYEAATSEQQMVLSLLAAREIIGNLTLKVASHQGPVERQWLTSAGVLNLEIDYQAATTTSGKLRIQAQLPCGGSVEMRCGQAESTSKRPDAGWLSVELFDPQPGQTYALDIRFHNIEEKPLMLVVCPVE